MIMKSMIFCIDSDSIELEPHSHPEEIHSGGEITTSESCTAATGSTLVLHDISSSDALTNETPTEECKKL